MQQTSELELDSFTAQAFASFISFKTRLSNIVNISDKEFEADFFLEGSSVGKVVIDLEKKTYKVLQDKRYKIKKTISELQRELSYIAIDGQYYEYDVYNAFYVLTLYSLEVREFGFTKVKNEVLNFSNN